MSNLQGWFIVSFLYGVFSGIIFYIIKDVIDQFKEIYNRKPDFTIWNIKKSNVIIKNHYDVFLIYLL